jgi:CheY-like chemotaxis protein
MAQDNLIMLVDDNKIDLFIHTEIIKQISSRATCMNFNFAGDALLYLSNKKDNWPNIILLDIHMPIMNGFDFLSQYKKFPNNLRAVCKIIMLSSSLNPNDQEKIKQESEVFAFIEKPLSEDKIRKAL